MDAAIAVAVTVLLIKVLLDEKHSLVASGSGMGGGTYKKAPMAIQLASKVPDMMPAAAPYMCMIIKL